MPRVLHVSQPTDAGVAQVVSHLLADQVRSGWDVVTACPPDGPLPAAAAATGARVVPWSAVREPSLATSGEVVRLRRLVDRVRPDLVHLHSAKAGLVGRLALRGRHPTVFQPHAWSFAAATGTLRSASVAWERYGTRWAHRTVYVSEQERADGQRLGITAPGVVVPNGIDIDRFPARDDTDRARARVDLGLGPGPVAVCVGRLCRQKGQDVLLSAWTRVVARVPDARLVLVGDGPDAEALRTGAPPSVRFAGVADPRPWYAAADVVVLPSRWEGMALVQLEAMASARCLVATDVGGVREALLPDDGVPDSPAVVPAEDPVALADAVALRLSRPELAAAEAAAARVRACRLHDVRRTTARMRAVYDELVPGCC